MPRLFALLLSVLLPAAAFAHDPWSSSTSVFIWDQEMQFELFLNPEAAYRLVDQPPQTRFVRPSDAEFETIVKPVLAPRVQDAFRVWVDDQVWEPIETELFLNDERDIGFWLKFPRPPGGQLRIELAYMPKMIEEHRTVLDVYISGRIDPIFYDFDLSPEDYTREFRCPRPRPPEPPPADPAANPDAGPGTPDAVPAKPQREEEEEFVPITPPFSKILWMGVDHIWGGYDHLLFLAGLLIVCQRFSSIAKIITCFTIAHSITLGFTALDVVIPNSKYVEAAIAATIVYVGIENLFVKDEPKYRWVLTFIFGLIHGFGFGGFFRDTVQGADIVMPLLAFNLGVELGQLAVVIVVLPILWQLRKIPGFTKYVIPAMSLCVIAMGLVWLDDRLEWNVVARLTEWLSGRPRG